MLIRSRRCIECGTAIHDRPEPCRTKNIKVIVESPSKKYKRIRALLAIEAPATLSFKFLSIRGRRPDSLTNRLAALFVSRLYSKYAQKRKIIIDNGVGFAFDNFTDHKSFSTDQEPKLRNNSTRKSDTFRIKIHPSTS